MLNISENEISTKVHRSRYGSYALVVNQNGRQKVLRWMLGLALLGLVILFLPWTQTVNSYGRVTALRPDQRPQSIPAIIGGQIDRWYVREGQPVKKGDTIVHITEIKDEYFDPNLVERTREQVQAKRSALQSYSDKVVALDAQIRALEQGKEIKLQQTTNKVRQSRLKVISDSTDWLAAKLNQEIAEAQFKRSEQLYGEGLNSLTDLENRRLKLQESVAKTISIENKYLVSRNELLNAQSELFGVEYEYNDKLSKARSDLASSESAVFDGQGAVAKLENQLSTYSVRNGMYFITAPQDGVITKAIRTGIGETVKAGEDIITIMPANAQMATELYIAPVDLPLIHIDSKVRLIFDGWPALVFSGWPGISTGTYAGRVVAVDNFVSSNGKYRVLVSPDPEDEPWPPALRVGGAVQGVALLKDVAVGYEIWRRLNGFPPVYYSPELSPESSSKDKKEAKTEEKK